MRRNRKQLLLALLSPLALTLSWVGCDSNPLSSVDTTKKAADGGGDSEDAFSDDAQLDRITPSSCVPITVPNPTRPSVAYRRYLNPTNVCSGSQLGAFYSECVATDFGSAQCAAWRSEPTNAACGACVMVPALSTAWGAFVEVGNGIAVLNRAGCFGLTLEEGANESGCGAAVWAAERCLTNSCPTAACVGDPKYPSSAELRALASCRESSIDAGPCAPAVAQLAQKCGAFDAATSAKIEDSCTRGDGGASAELVRQILGLFCANSSAGDAAPADAAMDGSADGSSD
jgi:hypothetical protein